MVVPSSTSSSSSSRRRRRSSSSSSSSSSSRRPPPRAYTLLKMDYNGKGVGGVRGGGSSVLRKLIREATTRGMCVLESNYSIRGFRPMIYAGSSSTGSTFQWQALRRGDAKMSPLVDF